MSANRICVYTTDETAQSRPAFWAICLRALAALCLLMVLLTGCEQTGSKAGAEPPADVAQSIEREADDSGADDSGFVIEDTAVVDVEIDGE